MNNILWKFIRNMATLEQIQKKVQYSKFTLLSLMFLLSVTTLTGGIILLAKSQPLSGVSQLFKPAPVTFLLALGLICAVGNIGLVFFVVKKRAGVIHVYWLICAVSLIVIVLGIFTGVDFLELGLTQTCQQPINYFSLKLKTTSERAIQTFCKPSCPCSALAGKTQLSYTSVVDCPGWDDEQPTFSTFLQKIQGHLKCSGWCLISPHSYYSFYVPENYSQIKPTQAEMVPCYEAIRHWFLTVDQSYKIIGFLSCLCLIAFIVSANVYIFYIHEEQRKMNQKLRRQQKNKNKSKAQIQSRQEIKMVNND